MDKENRNKIKKMVQKCRKILEKEIGVLLEGDYGLHKDGTVEEISALSPEKKTEVEAIKVREGFVYVLEREAAAGNKKTEAVKKLILELAYTHLNRFVSLKLMEKRGVIRETVSRLEKSNGFLYYIVNVLGKKDISEIEEPNRGYREFLIWQCSQVAEELQVLFNPEDLSSYVFPGANVLRTVLTLINHPDLEHLWKRDETFGWLYQYFTPKELREKSRKESTAPRNSWELAFRNQFYTPRYIVQFLTDNTLGRIWYEMQKGNSQLTDECQYLVRPPKEVYKPRQKKDPRDIKVLDPACGSGHFLLYVFDLLGVIYREAYKDPELGLVLKEDYPDEKEFEKQIPRLILERNLYGVDIDLRSVQLTAIALWLRAQREWHSMGILRDNRPRVQEANLACAEPMPNNDELFEDFKGDLQPAVLGDLAKGVWERMRLAGEAGSLLQIEKELRGTINRAKTEWLTLPKETQLTLFGKPKEKQTTFNLRGIKDEDFFREAEEKVILTLKDLSTRVKKEKHEYQRRLFSEESIRGFQFIKILQTKFDVVLMNPPFGVTTPRTEELLNNAYPTWNKNLLCAFIERGLEFLDEGGALGAIYDRTAVVKTTYTNFRQEIILGSGTLYAMADTGWEVLDANVETTTMVFHKSLASYPDHDAYFFDIRDVPPDTKSKILLELIKTM